MKGYFGNNPWRIELKRNRNAQDCYDTSLRIRERFPDPQDREYYRRGGEAGRKAAKWGWTKSEHFNNKPEPYKLGYDEKYIQIRAELSQEDIEVIREAKASRRKRTKLLEPSYAAGSEPPKALESSFPLVRSQPYHLVAQEDGSFQESESLRISPQNVTSIISEYPYSPGFFNNENYSEINDLKTHTGNNLEEEADLLEILNEFDAQNKVLADSSKLSAPREHSLFSSAIQKSSKLEEKGAANNSEFSIN